MPGITDAGTLGGNTGAPTIAAVLLADDLTGTGTPPAARLKSGDIVVLTTAAALTASGAVVGRMLLAADKTANYKEGTPVAGLYGIVDGDYDTNSSGGPAGGEVSNGGVVFSVPNEGGLHRDRDTGRARARVIVATRDQVFRGKLASGTASASLINTRAGLTLSVSSGVTTYTVDTAAAAADQCLEITGYDVNNTSYVFFKVRDGFRQSETNVNYSTQ